MQERARLYTVYVAQYLHAIVSTFVVENKVACQQLVS